MKKRLKKKKIKQRYMRGIRLISEYAELSEVIVENEVGRILKEVASDLNEDLYDLVPYIDCVSIDLMIKYRTGWAGKEM